MNSKTRNLIGALIIGVIVGSLNYEYINSRVDEFRPRQSVRVTRVKKPITAGGQLIKANTDSVTLPAQFAPKSAITEGELTQYLGQNVTVDIKGGDYLLESYFSTREAVANRLSGLLNGENVRAVSLPVDETISLGRSIQTDDRVDILFTFTIPAAQQKISTVLLQNVPVIATGSFSAADQDTQGGARKAPYNILTLALPVQDAVRLNYARQVGQVSLMLRSQDDKSLVQTEPISSVVDILSAGDRARIEEMRRQDAAQTATTADKFKDQLRELMDKQRNQTGK